MQSNPIAANGLSTCLMLCLGLSLGCASPQAGNMADFERDKAQLLATIRQQREEVDALRDKTASLERRLAESETEIARLDPSRKVRGPTSASPESDLNWRSPAEVASEKTEALPRR